MAKVMPYSDAYGNAYETSYWRLARVIVGVTERNAQILFYGYRDADARTGAKLPIGQKLYRVGVQEFDAMYAAHIAPGGPNLMVLAYQHATNTLDTNGVSFFDGAEDA